jgi:putative DNA methylase
MSDYPVKSPRKLIEVALPLDAINAACAREKSIRHGHPSTLHLWWARRPLAAARAVIFSQLVNDPAGLWECQNPGARPSTQQRGAFTKRRQQLFQIIEELVLWENTSNEEVLGKARAEIRTSWHEVCELNKSHPQASELFNPENLPGLHDPFAGGGAIPLEAQRLGLSPYASDLNPVAVLINKSMIELPPKFVNMPPVSQYTRSNGSRKHELDLGRKWKGTAGLAEDMSFYGLKIRTLMMERIGHLYQPVEITPDITATREDLAQLVGQKLTVVAWLWARTVKCQNPGCGCTMPLLSTFILSSKAEKEAYLRPTKEGRNIKFTVSRTPDPALGDPKIGYKRGTSGIFECFACGTVTTRDYVAEQANSVGLGSVMTAIVCDGPNGRVFLPPNDATSHVELPLVNLDGLGLELAPNPRDVWCRNFGLRKVSDLFTPRQLVALTTICDLVEESREWIKQDAIDYGLKDTEILLRNGGTGALAYSEVISVYLSFLVGQLANHSSNVCGWNHPNTQMRAVFSRQTLPMTWDYAEVNVLSESSGSYLNLLERQIKGLSALGEGVPGHAIQSDAQTQKISFQKVVSTDPPYYDNIGYSDLSDFFYAWMRRCLRKVYPEILSTISAPKDSELVAASYRHGGKDRAENFFLSGMSKAMASIAEQAHPAFPVTIYYAFKQSETGSEVGTSSSGWETFLSAVFDSGFQISGTWPMRTEKEGRSIQNGFNALASSIVLVCRKRAKEAPSVSRREFIRELNNTLPEALNEMTRGSGEEVSPVAPVDFSQAIIGPGMAVFSKYSAVLEADGSAMSVRTALQLINRFLAEDDFDADTQFCLSWFEQNGWKDGPYGDAETLARGKGTSVDGVKDAGVIESGGGKVRLFKWSEYPTDWDPLTDNRTPVWEALHHLIRALKRDGGETASGALLAALGGKAEAVRQLAYRLYTLCERLGQAEDARAYNELITSWTGIETAAAAAPKPTDGQLPGFESA